MPCIARRHPRIATCPTPRNGHARTAPDNGIGEEFREGHDFSGGTIVAIASRIVARIFKKI
jgi:hypothetical protein